MKAVSHTLSFQRQLMDHPREVRRMMVGFIEAVADGWQSHQVTKVGTMTFIRAGDVTALC